MMSTKLILILIILVLTLCIICNKNTETFNPESNEAVQHISSIYGNRTATVSFNNANVTGTFTAANFKGIIVMWSGSITTIPVGWALCDGSNGTPDLRSKFVVGASSPNTPYAQSATASPNYPGLWLAPRGVGDQGGEENHLLTVNEIPSHTHPVNYQGVGCSGPYCATAGNGNPGFSGGLNYSNPTNSQLLIASATGGGAVHNNMPPFYALAYIIKL